MSAQGGTLQRRRTIELPLWPVVALVVAALGAAIGTTLLREQGQTRAVTPVTESERFANSTAAVREQGATLPVIAGISHVAPSVQPAEGYAGFENPGAYMPAVQPAEGFAGFENPGAYVVQTPAYTGFENPAAYATAWGSIGGPNEALHRQFSPPQVEAPTTGSGPIVVNGQVCGQCK